jgi:hypothetical protein
MSSEKRLGAVDEWWSIVIDVIKELTARGASEAEAVESAVEVADNIVFSHVADDVPF